MEVLGLTIILSSIVMLLAEPLVIPLVFGRDASAVARAASRQRNAKREPDWHYEPPELR